MNMMKVNETHDHAVYEPFIGFLTYLEPQLWHNNQKVVKIYTATNASLGWITPVLYMAVTRRQNMLV